MEYFVVVENKNLNRRKVVRRKGRSLSSVNWFGKEAKYCACSHMSQVLWANIFLCVNMHNTWLLYKTSSHYSIIFPYLLTTFLLLRFLFSTTTKYSTQPNLTTTTFLPFLKHYLLNTTNPSSTLVLRPVKNYNFSRNYSNVVLLVESFFVI